MVQQHVPPHENEALVPFLWTYEVENGLVKAHRRKRLAETTRPIARVIFCIEQGSMVLLHGFMKKSQKTPQQDIELALKWKKGTRT